MAGMPETHFANARAQLLRLLSTLSFRLGQFTLSSGAQSDYYIDCRTTTLHAEGGRLAGIVMLEMIRNLGAAPVAVGGLTMGADPLVCNISAASAWEISEAHGFRACPEQSRTGNENVRGLSEGHGFSRAVDSQESSGALAPEGLVHGFLVRKQEKTHGAGKKIEGFHQPGARVVIVDDVCTTGGSTITAIAAAREAGMEVVAVLCLVEREEHNGRPAVEAAAGPGVPFLAVFTAEDVRADHVRETRS
jgi:orotate phosphoribosyltransferase